MLYSSLGLSSFMFLAIIIGLAVMFKKLKYITPYNLSLYIILMVFWVTVRVFSDHIYYPIAKLDNNLVIPLILGLTWIVQVLTRAFFAFVIYKTRSRKTCIVMAFTGFFIMVIPFIAVQNTATFIIMAFGTGFFAGSFGIENIYFQQNWSMHHAFISVALMSFLPTLGIFASKIIANAHMAALGSTNFADFDFVGVVRWILLGLLIFSFIVLIFFVFYHKENKQRFWKEWQVLPADVTKLNVWDLCKISVIVFSFGLVNQLIFRSQVAQFTDLVIWDFAYIVILIGSVITALVTALYLIRHFRSQTIVMFSRIATLLSMVLGMILWFGHIHSTVLGALFLCIFTIAVTTYETTMIGVIVHFDQKNRFLMFAIWLCIRAVGYSVGDSVGGILEAKLYVPNNDTISQWLVLGGFIVIILTFTTLWMPPFMRVARMIYNHSDKYENIKLNKDTREEIWKK